MDHQEIAEQDIVDKYALGQLDGRTKQIFELHSLDCPQCQNDLELTLQLIEGMRARHQPSDQLDQAPENVTGITKQKSQFTNKLPTYIQAIAATLIVASALIFTPLMSNSPILTETSGAYTTLSFDTLRSNDNTHRVNAENVDSVVIRLSVGAPSLDENFTANSYQARVTTADGNSYQTQVIDDNWGDIELILDTGKLSTGPVKIEVQGQDSSDTREYNFIFTK